MGLHIVSHNSLRWAQRRILSFHLGGVLRSNFNLHLVQCVSFEGNYWKTTENSASGRSSIALARGSGWIDLTYSLRFVSQVLITTLSQSVVRQSKPWDFRPWRTAPVLWPVPLTSTLTNKLIEPGTYHTADGWVDSWSIYCGPIKYIWQASFARHSPLMCTREPTDRVL